VGAGQGPPFLVTALNGQGAATGTIGTGGAITATLSQNLDPTTALAANVIVLSKFQGKLNATVTYDVPSRTLTIQPSAPLIVGDTLSTLLTPGLITTVGQKLLPFQKQLTVIGAPFCVSNSFQPVTTNLPNVQFGSIEWADYDGDGKLDAVITGVTGFTFDTAFPFGPIYTYVTEVYHNDGNGHFTPINAGITPVGFGDAVWGDYDGDGKPDLLVMGRKQSHYLLSAQDGNPNDSLITTPGTGFAAVYHNNGDGTFTKVQEFFGFENGQAAWVDLNNDGKLDVVLVGITYGDISLVPPASILPPASSKIYRNVGGAFVDAGSLPVFNVAALAVADYDSDGRMDLSAGGYAYLPFSFPGISGLFAAPLTNIFHNLSGGISPLFPNTNGPLPELIAHVVDPFIELHRQGSGLEALLTGSVISDELSSSIQVLDRHVEIGLENLFVSRCPKGNRVELKRAASTCVQLFKALLRSALNGTPKHQKQGIQELKTVLYRYLEPMLGNEYRR